MQIVSASTIEQLDQHLRNAFNNNEDYDITLTGSLYMVAPYNADNPGLNPAPQYPYGPPGTERSSLPQIRSNVTIKASEAQYATLTRDLSASATYRHLYVRPGGSLTLERIVLEKGDVGTVDTGGGAILSQGVLTATHCRFGPDNKSNYGGAILNLNGTAILENCDIFGNEADWGGGLYNGFSPAVMTVINCRVAENRSVESWAVGGGIANMDGTLTVTGSAISDNSAATGGGIACYGIGQVTLQTAIVRSNHAGRGGAAFVKEGGTISLACSAVTSNTATTNGPVAWIENTGSITLENCWLPIFDGTTQSSIIGNISSGDIVNPLPPCYPKFRMEWQTDATLLPVWVYNRVEAANFAIAQSRSNFDDFPTTFDGIGSVGTGVHGSVGSTRNYSRVLDHQNNTGSAIFISECVHTGGLPMTRHPDPSEAMSCDEDGAIGTFDQKGWRVCPAAEFGWTYGSASPNWRDHLGVKRYFASDLFYAELTPGEVNPAVHFDDFLGTGLSGTIKSGGEAALASIFSSGDLATVEVGDYIFVPLQGVTSHGFLIVGWGPVLNTLEALNYDNLSQTHTGTHPIPYVADFCFGTNGTNDGTGWLQDPRPRPFYASAIEIVDSRLDSQYDHRDRLQFGFFLPFANSDGSRPNWQFYRIPSGMIVPSSRIYCE